MSEDHAFSKSFPIAVATDCDSPQRIRNPDVPVRGDDLQRGSFLRVRVAAGADAEAVDPELIRRTDRDAERSRTAQRRRRRTGRCRMQHRSQPVELLRVERTVRRRPAGEGMRGLRGPANGGDVHAVVHDDAAGADVRVRRARDASTGDRNDQRRRRRAVERSGEPAAGAGAEISTVGEAAAGIVTIALVAKL